MAFLKYFALYFATFIYMTITASGQSDGKTAEMESGSIELANALNNFGYKLTVQLMKENNNTNVLISPTGVNGLLAMALLGSVGRSHDELSDKLGFSQDVLSNRKHHEQLGHILDDLNNNDTYSKTMYANAIFVNMNYKLREIFQTYLSRVYKGEAKSVDFKDSAKVKSLINSWVNNNTNGKIAELLKNDLPLDTKAVLLSALYFSGQWEVPFLPEHTISLPFTTLSGDEIMIDQMLNMGKFRFVLSPDDGFDLIALPYNDSVTTLYALKPSFPKNKNIVEIMESTDYTKINNLINQMVNKQAIIRLPKMDLQSDLQLENPLKALGVKSIFSPSDANFALMVDTNSDSKNSEELIQRINDGDKAEVQNVINRLPNPGLYVDSVVHGVKLTIDEFGTEAAAATAAILARSVQQFYFNSPFYMFIRNEKTKLVTFSALIFNPND